MPTIFADLGRVTFKLGLKDPGPPASPASPTQNNWITLDAYHVQYIRSDGHNVEGVDVPYAFDGGHRRDGVRRRHDASDSRSCAIRQRGSALERPAVKSNRHLHDRQR